MLHSFCTAILNMKISILKPLIYICTYQPTTYIIPVHIREGPVILSKVKVTASFINRKKLKAAKSIPSNAIIITTWSVTRDHNHFFNDIGCNKENYVSFHI